MKLYHYTLPENCDQIMGRSISATAANKKGLIPRTPFDGDKNNRVTYCLFDPVPGDWVNNKEFPGVFDSLMLSTDGFLLEIKVDLSDGGIFVLDWAILERIRRAEPYQFSDDEVDYARIDYHASKIPLSEYLQNPNLNYGLPEVVITKTILPEMVAVSSEQRMLEKHLEYIHRVAPIHSERNLQRYAVVPELQPLIAEYEVRCPSNPEFKIA